MKFQTLMIVLVLGAVSGMISSPVHSENVCASFLCMAGRTQGQTFVEGCTGPIQAFFSPSLYIYDEEGIDWPLTAANRARWLAQCPGANGENTPIFTNIIARYGMSVY